jgi:hypothetical protein
VNESRGHSLRSVFIAIAVVAVLLGAYVGLARLTYDADREAMRSAYRDGRLTRERAVESLGPHDPVFSESSD